MTAAAEAVPRVPALMFHDLATDTAGVLGAWSERRVGSDCLFAHAFTYCMYEEVQEGLFCGNSFALCFWVDEVAVVFMRCRIGWSAERSIIDV